MLPAAAARLGLVCSRPSLGLLLLGWSYDAGTGNAAQTTGSPIRAIGILGTSGVLQPPRNWKAGTGNWKLQTGNSKIGKGTAEVRWSEPFFAEIKDHSDVAALRERVRNALAGLCEDTLVSDTEPEPKGS